MTPTLTLADYSIAVRCSYATCGELLPERAEVETYETSGSHWISARCPKCNRWTPVRLEEKNGRWLACRP